MTMAHSWIARLGSVFTLIGALLLLLGILLANGIYIPSLFFSIYQNLAFEDLEFKFISYAPLVESLCFLAGLGSLLLLQQHWWGKAASGVAVLGALLAALTIALLTWSFTGTSSPALGWLDQFSDWLVALGLIGCGIATLRAKALPRWNIIPLLLGLWLAFLAGKELVTPPRFFFISFPSDAPPPFPKELWVPIAQNLLTFVLLVCLGIALWPRKSQAFSQPAPPLAGA
jgi:hypothetical protein